jgi:hypothetical protein
MLSRRSRILAQIAAVAALAAPVLAWSAHGHRTITRLALDGLSADVPAFLRESLVIDRITEQSIEPDRWRGLRRPSINHDANTEHYIDVEDLEQFGLTLQTVPRYRYEYLKRMIVAKIEHPERIQPYDAAKDPDKSKEWPGFLPHAIEEHVDKLRSSFSTLRILEAINDPAHEALRIQTRENIIYEMGILSHFVGDTSQPLHTTRHHHGWVGPNPEGYTTDYGFHAYIDGAIVDLHGLDFEALRPRMTYTRVVNSMDPWADCIGYIQRSFDRVERLTDAGEMLAALYNAAWERSKPTDGDVANFLRYDHRRKAPAAVPASPVDADK